MARIRRIAGRGKRLLRGVIAWPAERARAHAGEEERVEWQRRGLAFAESWPSSTAGRRRGDGDNPLRAFFNARKEGRGIWKVDHYFDVYHRHFERFRGTEVDVLEIGVGSGGSLDMWHEYFGPRARLYGVDLQEACLRYADESTRIFIGDQSDREFWRAFRAEVPKLDIVVDDGGHEPLLQTTSLEELLFHLRPGGLYVVEDHTGSTSRFPAYVSGLVRALNAWHGRSDHENPERRKVSQAEGFQSLVHSIHSYPFATVIERRRDPVAEFVSAKHGTEWESFAR
jgi:SAM-dependent methyltransferase